MAVRGSTLLNPTIARWGVVDPLNEFASPYVYLGNNPVVLVDPTGMAHEDSMQEMAGKTRLLCSADERLFGGEVFGT